MECNVTYSKTCVVISCLEGNAKIVSAERGLQDITTAMDNHNEVSDLIEAACSAIWSLSMDGMFIIVGYYGYYSCYVLLLAFYVIVTTSVTKLLLLDILY